MADPISHVNVWSGDDELVVTWRGGSAQVSVFVSDDPIDAGVDVRAPDGAGRVVVERGERRRYLHLFDPGHGFTVAAERRIRLDGPDNFRDLGGYPTADGCQSRWGRVFRSDRLDGLTDDDHRALGELGIGTVFDLRSHDELARRPDRLPDGVRYLHRPMSTDVATHRGLLDRIAGGHISSFTRRDMADGYLRMLEVYRRRLAEVITAVADGERIVVHCTAGKDRTGIVAMALLGLAGITEGHLLDDYELSARYQPPGNVERFAEKVREVGKDPDAYDLATMLGAPREVMRSTLEGLRQRWGDHVGYARFAGLDDITVEAARANLRFAPDGGVV